MRFGHFLCNTDKKNIGIVIQSLGVYGFGDCGFENDGLGMMVLGINFFAS